MAGRRSRAGCSGRRGVGVLAVVVASSLATLALPAPLEALEEVDVNAVVDTLGALGTEAVAPAAAPALHLDATLRPAARGIRVALVSSGVDVSVFPEALRSQIVTLGSGGDPKGYGTAAASVLLQLDPGAQITSIGIYPYGRFHPDWHAGALEWAKINAAKLDAVLYAVPPPEFPDPVKATMAAGLWDATVDALSDASLPGAKGPVFGAPLWGHLRAALTQNLPAAERSLIDRFAVANMRWAQARAQVRAITAAGVAVVAPAGDQGAASATAGIANFPEVVTVGAFDGRGVSSVSTSGPAMDGRVKPDLVAPTGLVTVLPEASVTARALAARALLDPSLELAWPAGDPLSAARIRLDSTMVSAAVVAGATAGLAAEGVRDVARQRGALTAAAVPLAGVEVWRQGAGVLRRLPDAAFAASRPLALSHADLGAEPDAGAWTTTVAFANAAPTAATVSLPDLLTVGTGARSETSTVAGDQAPAPAVAVSDAGVTVSLGVGDSRYRGGLYCGYSEVSVPLTDDAVDPSVEASGIPSGTEQVPTCLVKGSRLRAHGFYIHDTPAEDLTFSLLPALPPGASVLEHPLMLLPVDPLATRLFTRVTGADGNAVFPNIPPGYYRIRQFSDYGAPIAETAADGTAGATTDIGEKIAYQSFDALVLPGVCQDDDGTPTCGDDLRARFGAENVEFEKSTWGYLVTVGPQKIRVVFDRVKKMPGANVASRYIDVVDAARDVQWCSAALGGGAVAQLTGCKTALGDLRVGPSLDGRGVSVLSAAIGTYPFSLTTPNYKAHMSLNFRYDLTNAVIVPVVVVGRSVHYGVVSPVSTLQQPSVGPSTPLRLPGVQVLGRAAGTANFEFHMLPRGASSGTLYFVVVPAGNTTLSKAEITDVSFELDTWNNALWPATTLPRGQLSVDGHSFRVHPNYSTRQLPPAALDPREDWVVMVHSPGDDAATFDVIANPGSAAAASVMGAIAGNDRGGLYDPRRGRHVATSTLVFATPSIAGVETSLLSNTLHTNGRFWEQLLVPRSVLAGGPLEFRIVDNEPGRASALLPHATGPVPVKPYARFRSEATVVSQPALPRL